MQCSVGARRTCRSESSPTPESAWAGRVHPGPPATHEHGCSCSDRARRFQIRTSQVAPMATQTAAPLLMDGGRGRTWRRQHTLRVRATGASDAAADRRHQHCAGCARSRQRYTCRRHESHCHPGVARQAPRLTRTTSGWRDAGSGAATPLAHAQYSWRHLRLVRPRPPGCRSVCRGVLSNAQIYRRHPERRPVAVRHVPSHTQRLSGPASQTTACGLSLSARCGTLSLRSVPSRHGGASAPHWYHCSLACVGPGPALPSGIGAGQVLLLRDRVLASSGL